MKSRTRHVADRRGFALIAILWLIVAMAALGLDDSANAHDAIATTQSRMDILRATWIAEGCGDIARATADVALADTLVAAGVAWDTLDRSIATLQSTFPRCRITWRAAGDRLNVNTADGDALSAAFIAAGVAEERADSLAAAILDWRDGDTIPRLRGAEAGWYRRAGRVVPTNRPFESAAEIYLVRGFDTADSLVALLGVEPGRIVLDRAPLPVIASLPGITPEIVARIAELRWKGELIGDGSALGGSLSEESRKRMAGSYSHLTALVSSEPDAWIIRITASSGTPPVNVIEELRLVRAARRAGVTRARVWP